MSVNATTTRPFIIDVVTPGSKILANRLGRLKATHRVEVDGQYAIAPEYSRIYVETEWDEPTLDQWLCNVKGVDFVGIAAVDRRPQ